MMKQFLKKSFALSVALLIMQTSHLAIAASQGVGGVERQVRLAPTGSSVEVRLKNNDKLRGKLGSIYDDGFELQATKSGATVRVAFIDVESVRQKEGMSTRKKVGIGLGMFAGLAVLVTYLVVAAIASNG